MIYENVISRLSIGRLLKSDDSGAPGRWWFLRQETTQRINPTKQGYCLIIVPATGVIWSTVWSTIRIPPASATPPPRDTVHEPDLRLGFDNRQLATSAYFMGLDGFICAVGWRLCALLKLLPKLMHNTPA